MVIVLALFSLQEIRLQAHYPASIWMQNGQAAQKFSHMNMMESCVNVSSRLSFLISPSHMATVHWKAIRGSPITARQAADPDYEVVDIT